MITALLPMKGHSERVKNKNFKIFCGAPLYHIVMRSLLSTKNIDFVAIDTDSESIKRDALNSFDRVMIIDRPKDVQGDFVSMNKIINYDLSQLDGQHFIQTHATNPLIKSETIDKAIDVYFDILPNKDSLFSVTRLQKRLYWKNGSPVNHDPTQLLRTQDLPPIFEENSNFYIFSKDSFQRAGDNRIGIRSKMFEVPQLESIDIDEREDFVLAETIYNMKKENNEI